MTEKRDESQNQRERYWILGNLHTSIDSNIRIIRTGLYVVCGVGVILIGRSYYVTRVFQNVEEIPGALIHRHISLLGRVKEITDDGMLKVRHVPLVKVPFIQKNKDSSLLVKLACIDISPDGRLWLKDTAINKKVRLKVLHRNVQTLHCNVLVPKWFRGWSINEDLMKRGLCKISMPQHLQYDFGEELTTNNRLLNYLDRMVYLESKASRKEAGLWKVRKPPVDRTWMNASLNLVKSVMSSPFRLVSWMYKKMRRKKENK